MLQKLCLRVQLFIIVIIIYLNEMRVTMKEQQIKRQQSESKSMIRPIAYEMVHYPTDGLLQELAFMLIRPPRFSYNQDILKPSKRISHRFIIETFAIPFELTFYKQKSMRYVILYLHGNGSSRFQGTLFLPSLPQGVGLACFDFCGCGNRTEGEFITLGQEQCKDADKAAIFLKSKGYYVVGWGRSMGAVSLLMSNQCNLMVSDSAYSNLSLLCKQSSSKFLPKACCCIFHCFFPCAFACIKCKVHSLSGLSIQNMNITERLEKLQETKQICFIHGESDVLVACYHSQKLYECFKGRKLLVLFQGTHNSSRPTDTLQKCFQFIEQGLQQQNRKEVNINNEKLLQMANLHIALNKDEEAKLEQIQISHSANEMLINNDESLQANPSIKQQCAPFANEHTLYLQQLKKLSIDEQYCQIGLKQKQPANSQSSSEYGTLQMIPQKGQSKEQSIKKQKQFELVALIKKQ